MKANELRIGNLVECKYSDGSGVCFEHEIMIGDFEDLSNGQSLESDFQPIPLIEEWLERFGFENDGPSWSSHDLFSIQKTEKGWFAFVYSRHSTIDISSYFHNVHQLQNLYFALTNTELNDQTTED